MAAFVVSYGRQGGQAFGSMGVTKLWVGALRASALAREAARLHMSVWMGRGLSLETLVDGWVSEWAIGANTAERGAESRCAARMSVHWHGDANIVFGLYLMTLVDFVGHRHTRYASPANKV